MKIVIVVHYLFPHITGTDVGAFEQAKRYAGLGHMVTMISSNLHKSSSEEVKNGVNVRRVFALNFLEDIGIPYPLFSVRLVKVMREEIRQADIVHVHGMLYISSIVAIRMARFYRKPVVLTQTAPDRYHYRPREAFHVLSKIVERCKAIAIAFLEGCSVLIGKRNLVLSDQITTLSLPLKKMLVEMGISEEKIEYISNGVDTDFFKPASQDAKKALRKKWSLPENKKIILSIGRFVPKKGLDIFIKAADPEYQLIIVTNCNQIKLINEAPGPVHLFDPMAQEKLLEIYQASDVFVLAAKGEDVFSLVLMEAMACGLPIVTSNDPFYRNYVDEAHVALIEPTSDNIRTYIKRLINDQPLYARMSAYSRSTAERVFSWDARIKRYLAIYERLAACK